MSDLISIQMAIEHWGRSSGNLTNDQIAELQREIESLPSSEPKTGKWVKAVNDGVVSYADVYAKCDQCHKVEFNGWGMNYCPNCGARMLGEDGEA